MPDLEENGGTHTAESGYEPPPVPSAHSRSLRERVLASKRFNGLLGVLTVVGFINWQAWFGYCLSCGGDALGTVPEKGRFFVTSHGRETVVDEATWVRNLHYSYFSLMFFPVGFFTFGLLVLRTIYSRQVGRETDPGKQEKGRRNMLIFTSVSAGFFAFFVLVWWAATTRDYVLSLGAYLSLA